MAEVGNWKLEQQLRFPFPFLPSALPRGYTLVEMLIVVTIVGLMATVILPTMNSASGSPIPG